MRLLHTSEFTLVDFPSPPLKYAILSHTWGTPPENEVLFKDMESGLEAAQEKASFVKVEKTCGQARSDGYEYCWIDTCCIDKSSSAELQEAINSMFEWYEKATICYVYLSDVDRNATRGLKAELHDSKWFTRGWTLQELIAPTETNFFAKNWEVIGTRESLHEEVEEITRIPACFLNRRGPPHFLNRKSALQDASVAGRMSWASKRETSRPEDLAYCLMGIFDVNMPLLYGEGGKKSFLRLQEEIIKCSEDHSIFAWRDPELNANDRHGLLADKPSQFADFLDDLKDDDKWNIDEDPFSLTNKGLRIQADLIEIRWNPSIVYVMRLNFRVVAQNMHRYQPGIILEQVGDRNFTRISVGQLALLQTFYIPPRIIFVSLRPRDTRNSTEEPVLPLNPGHYCRYVLCSEELLSHQSSVPRLDAKPIYLSDNKSPLKWTQIAWAVPLSGPRTMESKSGCICLRRYDGEILTVHLKDSVTPETLGDNPFEVDSDHRWFFHASRKDRRLKKTFSGPGMLPGRSAVQELAQDKIEVFRFSDERFEETASSYPRDLVFLVEVWNRGDSGWM